MFTFNLKYFLFAVEWWVMLAYTLGIVTVLIVEKRYTGKA